MWNIGLRSALLLAMHMLVGVAVPCDLYSDKQTCVFYNRTSGFINICPAVSNTFWNSRLLVHELSTSPQNQQYDGSDSRCISVRTEYISEFRSFLGFVDYFTGSGDVLRATSTVQPVRTFELEAGPCNETRDGLDACAPALGMEGADIPFSYSKNPIGHKIRISALPFFFALSESKNITVEVWLFQNSGTVSFADRFWYAEAGSVAFSLSAEGYEFTSADIRQMFALEFTVRTFGLDSLKVWLNNEVGPISGGSTADIVDVSDASIRVMKYFVSRPSSVSNTTRINEVTVDTRLHGDQRVLSLMFSPAPFNSFSGLFFVPRIGGSVPNEASIVDFGNFAGILFSIFLILFVYN
eukprot:GILI01023115.1.p1 GENE.GILI01023115.1~~GILI01023115.1.p1  ORF type:complete len:382 (+),score=11.47 GILI01023115.1:90-1148(+)